MKMNVEQIKDCQSWLMYAYELERSKRDTFSMRQFAKNLGVSSGALSQIINRRRPLTWNTAMTLANGLALDPEERQKFLSLLTSEPEKAVLRETASNGSYEGIELDEFRVIGDWYHFAILNLCKVKGTKNDPVIFAKKLNISVQEAKDGIERLQRLGYVNEAKDKTLRVAKNKVSMTTEAPAVAVRKYFRQNLRKAEAALADTPIEMRDFHAITFAMDPDQIPVVKAKITQFARKLCQEMERTTPKNVYTLFVQFFPLETPSLREGH